MLHAAPNCQDAADALIADDAGQRRSDRKCALNHVKVVHIDRRVLDTDQHLTGSRSRRLRHVGKLEHFRRFTKGLDQRCTHWRFSPLTQRLPKLTRSRPASGPPACCKRPPVARPPRETGTQPKPSITPLTNSVVASCSP